MTAPHRNGRDYNTADSHCRDRTDRVTGMRFLSRLFALLVLVALVGGAVFLATWDIPPPTATMTTDLPDDRFPR